MPLSFVENHNASVAFVISLPKSRLTALPPKFVLATTFLICRLPPLILSADLNFQDRIMRGTRGTRNNLC